MLAFWDEVETVWWNCRCRVTVKLTKAWKENTLSSTMRQRFDTCTIRYVGRHSRQTNLAITNSWKPDKLFVITGKPYLVYRNSCSVKIKYKLFENFRCLTRGLQIKSKKNKVLLHLTIGSISFFHISPIISSKDAI